MKYYYEKPEEWVSAGYICTCDHPLFNRCTVFQNGSYGLCIVQEYFNEKTKVRWWSAVEPWLAGDIYLNPNFKDFFKENAAEKDENRLFPIFSVRKVMWALRMKPLKKAYWEDGL